MTPDPPELQKLSKETPPPNESSAGPATDEDILRLRSRLDREMAMVAQKLTDAEESIIDMEMAVRAQETGSRPRLPGASAPGEKATEKVTARMKAVGEGLNKFKDWVVRPHAKEGGTAEDAPESPSSPKSADDLEVRLEQTLHSIQLEIRDREQSATELDRKLHEAQKDLIRHRAQEQHVREMQVRAGQTKQLSEDLDRKMALLDDMVRTYESSTKSDTGIRTRPKEQGPTIPKFEDRLQSAIDAALKAVAAQEKRVTEIEKDLERANGALIEERTRQQRVRTMQIRLRQARHFSSDLQRALSGLASSIEQLRTRAGNLLKPEVKVARDGTRSLVKPSGSIPNGAPPPKTTSS